MTETIKTKRMQIVVSEELLKLVDEYKEKSGIATQKDFLNNAMSFFMWAIQESYEGKTIGSINPDSDDYTAMIMPAFNEAKRKGTKK